MSSLTLLGDTSGSVVLDAPPISGSTTITFAAQSGTLNVGGPAFSARKDGTQAITQNTVTKITYDIEIFDTNNNFASSRFTPTVSGYYQVNLTASIETTSADRYLQLFIYKNGTTIISAQPFYGSSAGANGMGGGISGVVYLNGTTDYIESYATTNSTTTVLNGTFNNTFSGCFLRGA
jgi:hypothetical protein